MGQWVNKRGELKQLCVGEAKASSNGDLVELIKPEIKWSNCEQAELLYRLEGRTRVCCNILGWVAIRGESPIKLEDSWFSAKSM